ncbi:hypothetical protein METHB2_490029 [Candidatus Methylobacter favarea]|uniref:Uncharacterized protein n=1 Tax=Candidatus Methylobacter favarea TaxID=2707345 RepID=A0A8S0WBH8_9GAMM|nr:hypothetical protein METHB2_490029 [Candidatus Methylobacter favarea]
MRISALALFAEGFRRGDFPETLKHLLGPDAPGLSAATISRLKRDYQDWNYMQIWCIENQAAYCC